MRKSSINGNVSIDFLGELAKAIDSWIVQVRQQFHHF